MRPGPFDHFADTAVDRSRNASSGVYLGVAVSEHRRLGQRQNDRQGVPGHENILKRLLVHARACNLGLWMRTMVGVGTPRGLQGRLAALGVLLRAVWTLIDDAMTLQPAPSLALPMSFSPESGFVHHGRA
jgi:hypothetical protein